MELVGIGTEIVECVRVGRMIDRHGEEFLRRVFTPAEIHAAQTRRRVTEQFAAYWAAKEAVAKSLGTRWTAQTDRTAVDLRLGRAGRMAVTLRGAAGELAASRGVAEVLVSVAHCRHYATATALAVRGIAPRIWEPE